MKFLINILHIDLNDYFIKNIYFNMVYSPWFKYENKTLKIK